MKQVKLHNVYIYYTKYKSSSVFLTFWKIDLKAFSLLVLNMNKSFSKIYIIPLSELTLDYIVLNFCLLDMTCFTYADDNFISHQLAWQKADCSKQHCTTEPMCWKKFCQHPQWGEDSVKLAYIVELLSRSHCWERKTMSKVSSGPRHTEKTIEWNKVFWTDELKFEIFWSNTRVYVW